MRLPVDDSIYQVDGVWLGPPGVTLPWRARYVDYAVGAGLFALLEVIELRLGIGAGFWPLVWTLLVTAALTQVIGSVVDHDRPLRSVVTAFTHQVTAGRGHAKPSVQTFRPPRRPR
jgi:hypothetical protein